MKRYFPLLVAAVIYAVSAAAQQSDLLRLTMPEIEERFLRENLAVIAEKYNIDKADAAIVQAKAWENPNLSISNISFWSTDSQRGGESEVIPPMAGSFGRNMEFSVELTQTIVLAGRRSKLAGMEKVGREMAVQQFEELLRGLRAELRKSVGMAVYLESYRTVLAAQAQTLEELVSACARQTANGNISKGALLRLQSALFDVQSELNETQTELNGVIRTLKSLLCIDPRVSLEIVPPACSPKSPAEIALGDLMYQATELRPDVKIAGLQTEYDRKSLVYEKSLRVPDLSVGVNYDRAGGVWRDFVGVGVGIDLPIFNRNKGGVRAAKYSIAQSEVLQRQQMLAVQYEVAEAYENYSQAYLFYRQISDSDFMDELDSMLGIYTGNMLDRNIGMTEYVDFVEAYCNNKKALLAARRNVAVQFEELQYTVGTDIK